MCLQPAKLYSGLLGLSICLSKVMNELAGNTARGQEYNEMQTQTTLYKCFGFLLGNTTHTLTTATNRIHCIYSQIGRLCQCLCKRMATKAAAMGHGTARFHPREHLCARTIHTVFSWPFVNPSSPLTTMTPLYHCMFHFPTKYSLLHCQPSAT